MTQRRKFPLPLWTVALDAFGMILIGLGIFGLVSEVGAAEDMKALSIAAIVVGVLLMLPMVAAAVRLGMSRRRAG